MSRSRLPRMRRISQIVFLLLFLALLLFTSLNLFIGGATEIQLRAPVRLFFEWDPLVALVNALAGHALYRGLIWSLLILAPTLFLGRFFCGWICPMGTLQHFAGNLPSEAKRGKQRIESNRYKRWQTGKYVVLIAGLVAALFGSAAISFLMSFADFNTTLMLVGADSPLTVMMYGRMREGATPVLNAVSLFLMLASALLALSLMRGGSKKPG